MFDEICIIVIKELKREGNMELKKDVSSN